MFSNNNFSYIKTIFNIYRLVLNTYYVHYDTHWHCVVRSLVYSAVLYKIDSKVLSLIYRLFILIIDPKRFVN